MRRVVGPELEAGLFNAKLHIGRHQEVIGELGMPLNGVLSADGLIVADISNVFHLFPSFSLHIHVPLFLMMKHANALFIIYKVFFSKWAFRHIIYLT